MSGLLLYCRNHQAYLPSESFYPASARCGESRCKPCNNRARLERRKADPLRWLQWKLYRSERARQQKHPVVFPKMDSIQQIYQRYHGRSALSSSSSNLCIVRFYSDLPIGEHPWNAVLVTSQEARQLPRSPCKRAAAFPHALQQAMHINRMCSFGIGKT